MSRADGWPDLKDMTYDQMIDYASWNLAQSIIRGQPLREGVFMIALTVRAWHDEQAKLKKLKKEK